jgi:hypothetical protein
LDKVELDLLVAQLLQRAAGVSSAGIVVENDSLHAFPRADFLVSIGGAPRKDQSRSVALSPKIREGADYARD